MAATTAELNNYVRDYNAYKAESIDYLAHQEKK